MKCNEAELYMMKYMDGDLPERDAAKLHKHLSVCDECKETFYTYDFIMNEFSEEIFAPSNLEAKIMAEIKCVAPNFIITDNRKSENFNSMVWGIFSVIFGLGVIASLYSQQIMGYVSANETLQYIYLHILPSVTLVTNAGSSATQYFTNAAAALGSYVESVKYVLLAVLAVLVGLQVALYRKNKSEAEA